MLYLLLRKRFDNHKNGVNWLLGVIDCDLLSEPSLALKKESGLDGHYPEGPPDLRVLTQHAHQFL